MRSWVFIVVALWCCGWPELIKGIEGDNWLQQALSVKKNGSLFQSMNKRKKQAETIVTKK